MDDNHKLNRKLVTGMSGSGKTSLAIHLLKNWDSKPKPKWIFCFDPDREISRKSNWTVVIEKREIIRLASQFRPVCFDPIPMFGAAHLEKALDWYCGTVLDMARKVNGTKLLCIDEIWKYTGRVLPDNLKAIGHEGRRQEIDTLIISQQLNDTNATLRAQLTQLWTFRQEDKRPIEWLDEAGFDPDQVRNLEYPDDEKPGVGGGFIVRTIGKGFQTGKTSRAGIPFFDAPHKTRKADRPARVA